MSSLSQNLLLRSLEGLRGGSLELSSGGSRWSFGDPGTGIAARIDVHDQRFFSRAVFGGDIGIGEAWMDGDWSSPDLVAVVRLAVRNLAGLERGNRLLSAVSRAADTVRHRLRGNTLSGSRRNVRAHYDLSNEFFRLFLDRSLMYSCAYYQAPGDSLERAQEQKLERICRKLRLGPQDHVLEIGTGWGGFAEHAAARYGCRVTTTTISARQHDLARERFAASPAGGRIELLKEDYRALRGRYDKLVSIEMFEAVGLAYYDEFFGACERLLKPGGSMLMQVITINEQAFPAYHGRSDWIQKYIFPGSELASLGEIVRSLARVTSLSIHNAEGIGSPDARTLAEWRRRFHAAASDVRALGFDERFIRMWDYYLAYCEGAFLERHINDFQLLIAGNRGGTALFDEPWDGPPSP